MYIIFTCQCVTKLHCHTRLLCPKQKQKSIPWDVFFYFWNVSKNEGREQGRNNLWVCWLLLPSTTEMVWGKNSRSTTDYGNIWFWMRQVYLGKYRNKVAYTSPILHMAIKYLIELGIHYKRFEMLTAVLKFSQLKNWFKS